MIAKSLRCIAAVAPCALAIAACGPSATRPTNAAPLVVPTVASAAPPPDPLAGLRLTPDALFRAKPPAADGVVAFTPPTFSTFTLKNGIPVTFLRDIARPFVHISMLFIGGSGGFPQEHNGAMGFLPAAMFEGTHTHSRSDLDDELVSLFAKEQLFTGGDAIGIGLSVVPKKLDAAIALLTEIFKQPIFDASKIERARDQRVVGLERGYRDPASMAYRVFVRALYGATHPLAMEREDPAQVRTLTRDDLAHAYEHAVHPGTMRVLVAGNIDQSDLQTTLEAELGAWVAPKAAALPARLPAPPPPVAGSPRLIVVDRPGAAQAQVIFGGFGVDPSAADFESSKVLNGVLGDLSTSRLGQKLRQALGAYRGRSYVSFARGVGPLYWEGDVAGPQVSEALTVIDGQMRAICKDGVTAEELKATTAWLVGGIPQEVTDLSGVMHAMYDQAVYDRPLDYWTKLPSVLEAVTLDDVQRAAQAHLDPSQMKIVVVGDYSTLRPKLVALGWGPIELRDAAGAVLRVDTP